MLLTQTLDIGTPHQSNAACNGQRHQRGGQAVSSRPRCRSAGFRPRRVVAAATPPEKESPPGKAPATLVEKTVTGLVKRQFDEAAARRVLDNLQKLGVEKPEQLRKLFINRGVTQLLSRAVREQGGRHIFSRDDSLPCHRAADLRGAERRGGIHRLPVI
jgi:hypothetical protein